MYAVWIASKGLSAPKQNLQNFAKRLFRDWMIFLKKPNGQGTSMGSRPMTVWDRLIWENRYPFTLSTGRMRVIICRVRRLNRCCKNRDTGWFLSGWTALFEPSLKFTRRAPIRLLPRRDP